MTPPTIESLIKRNGLLASKNHYWQQIALGKDEQTQAIVRENIRLKKCLTDIQERYDDIIINRDLLNYKDGE